MEWFWPEGFYTIVMVGSFVLGAFALKLPIAIALSGAAVVGALAALIAALGTAGIVIDAVLGVGFMVAVFLRARPERIDASSLEAEVAAAGAVVRKRRDRA